MGGDSCPDGRFTVSNLLDIQEAQDVLNFQYVIL